MENNSLNNLASKILEASNKKGFNEDGKFNIGEKLMLIVSELGEALEADRINRHASINISNINEIKSDLDKYAKGDLVSLFGITFKDNIKDTFEDEMADTLIRILELCALMNIDIDWHVKSKMYYNETREHKNGGKKILIMETTSVITGDYPLAHLINLVNSEGEIVKNVYSYDTKTQIAFIYKRNEDGNLIRVKDAPDKFHYELEEVSLPGSRLEFKITSLFGVKANVAFRLGSPSHFESGLKTIQSDIVRKESNSGVKCIAVEEQLLKSYLTEDAYRLVKTPVLSTIVEQMEVDLENSTEGNTKYKRVAYLVQYLSALTESIPTINQIEQFCNIINKIVGEGDLFIGSLAPLSYLPLSDGRYMIIQYSVSKLSFEQLVEKYGDIFIQEGELPKIILK